MNLIIKDKKFNDLISKFLEGGAMEAPAEAMPAELAAPEQGAEQDPLVLIVQAAAQAVQTNDGQLALQVCQALVQLAQQSAPQGPPPGQEPVYKRGGKLSRWISR